MELVLASIEELDNSSDPQQNMTEEEKLASMTRGGESSVETVQGRPSHVVDRRERWRPLKRAKVQGR